MPIIRTPEERFDNLPGFPFEPHYVDVDGARMHYLDEGEGQPILCLHGEPTWSYLYRKMIPILSTAGRVIAPDYIGFGKSDKHTEQDKYTFQMHRDTLVNLIDALQLQNITVIVQDWGGMLGLRLVGEMPERFARLVILNTFLPTGARKPALAFRAWRAFARLVPSLPVGMILRLGTEQPMSKEVIRAYEAPFPSRKYKVGAKAFPQIVPVSPHIPGVESMKRARKVLGEWTKPALVMFSDNDPIMLGADRFFRRLIPSASDQPEITIRNAGHFLQEDKGEEIAQHVVDFMQRD